ncbi:MAG TPA: YfhO family protein [Mycobacteriales bacterium]
MTTDARPREGAVPPPTEPSPAPPLPPRRRLWLEAIGVYAAYQAFTVVVLKALRVSGQTFFQDVLVNGIGPDRQGTADFLRHGFFPTWTRDTFGGGPFVANIQHAVYYLGNAPFLFLPTSAALEVVVATTVAFAAFSMWCYCRFALRTSGAAALLGGLAFGFGGMSLQHVILTNQLQAIAWMPLVLLFGHLALDRGRLRWVVATAVAVGMQFLAGHPEEWVYTVGALALYGLVWTFGDGLRAWWRRAVRAAVSLGGAIVLFVLLFGFQLYPTLLLRSQGFRQAPSFREQYPLPKAIAVNSLLPDFGRVVYGENPSHIGLVALGFAVLGLAVRGTREQRWLRAFLAVLAAFGFVMALGNATPFYRFAYDHVSVVRGFRVPSRYLMLPTFGLAAAAAYGVDALLAPGTRRARLVDAGRALALLVAGGVFVFALGDMASPTGSLTEWAVAGFVGVAAWAAAAFPKVPRLLLVTALVVTTGYELQLARPRAEYHQVAPDATYDEYGPVIERMAREGGRFVTDGKLPSEGATGGTPIPIPAGIAPGVESDYYRAGHNFRVIARPNVHTALHAETVLGRDGGLMPFRLYSEFFTVSMNVGAGVYRGVHLAPPSKWSWETLDFLGVRWFVTNPLPASEQAVLAAHGFTRAEAYAFGELWGRPAPPILRTVSDVRVVPDPAERLRVLDEFPLQKAAVVEEPVDVSGTGTVRDVRVGQTTVRATVDAAAPTLLVLSDPWYPQWHAYLDGEETDLLRVDHAFRGVRVPAGTHRVEFRYEDSAHVRGVVLALLTVLGLVAATVLLNRRRRPREE